MFSPTTPLIFRKEPTLTEVGEAPSALTNKTQKRSRFGAMVALSIVGHAAGLYLLSLGYSTLPVQPKAQAASESSLKATLWFASTPASASAPVIVELPKVPASSVAPKIPQHELAKKQAVSSFETLVEQVKVPKVVSVAASNEELAKMMEQHPPEPQSKELQEPAIEIVKDVDISQPQPHQPASLNNADQDTPKDQGELSFEPLLMYQLKIASKLQSNLRMRQELKGARCSVRINLSRDGMVLSQRYLGGSELLCEEVAKSVERSGHLPMPADKSLYVHLRDLKIEVVAPDI